MFGEFVWLVWRVVWQICLANLFGRICLANLFGGFVWRICLADLFGEFVWRICLANLAKLANLANLVNLAIFPKCVQSIETNIDKYK